MIEYYSKVLIYIIIVFNIVKILHKVCDCYYVIEVISLFLNKLRLLFSPKGYDKNYSESYNLCDLFDL